MELLASLFVGEIAEHFGLGFALLAGSFKLPFTSLGGTRHSRLLFVWAVASVFMQTRSG